MLTQVEEFKNATDLNKWLQENHGKVEIVEFKYVGNRHYGTSILVVYRKNIENYEVTIWIESRLKSWIN